MGDMEISDEVVSFFENLNAEPTEEAPAETTTEEVVEPTTETEVVEETVEPTTETETAEDVVEPVATEETEPQEQEVNWEDRYKHLQSQKDREVAAVSEQLNQLQQWAQQQYAWQQQLIAETQQQQQAQVQQTTQVSREQVDQQLDVNPIGTFQWVAANRPDLMPNVISMVREKEKLGNEVADAMMAEWTQYQIQQQQAAFQQQLQQQQQDMELQQAPQQVEGTMQQIVGVLEERHGEPFKALQDDIAAKAAEAAPHFQQYMNQNGLDITPQAVADFITQIYLDVREEKLNTKSVQPAGPVKLAPSQHVENPGALRQRDTTPDEDAMNELLQGAKNLGIDVTAAASA